MRALPLAALGAAAYAAFLVATMPASFALARAAAAMPGQLEVVQADGTVWHGNARITFNTPGGPVALDRVEWNWLPSRLASGRFAFGLSASAKGLDARAEGARTLTQWEARDLQARGEAPALVALLPWLAAWRPEGAVSIASPRLESDGNGVRGEARIEWKGAAVALSEVRPLGSYRADLVAEGQGGSLRVSTLEGALQVTGQGALTPPSRIAFRGEARASAEQAKALAPLLDLMGPARADGSRTLDWRTN